MRGWGPRELQWWVCWPLPTGTSLLPRFIPAPRDQDRDPGHPGHPAYRGGQRLAQPQKLRREQRPGLQKPARGQGLASQGLASQGPLGERPLQGGTKGARWARCEAGLGEASGAGAVSSSSGGGFGSQLHSLHPREGQELPIVTQEPEGGLWSTMSPSLSPTPNG